MTESKSSTASVLNTLWPETRAEDERLQQWREEMFCAIIEAHRDAAIKNDCVSSFAFKMAVTGGSSVPACMIAGLSTIGSRHAPVIFARDILFHKNQDEWMLLFEAGERVPGFGNDFHKDGIDPSFARAFELLPMGVGQRLADIAEYISETKGASIYPNAAAITAAAAHVLNLPPRAELLIFMIGRGAGWLNFI